MGKIGMKPAFILIFLILALIIGILVVKYVFTTFPGLQQKASSGGDAGIFKSINQGESWVHLAAQRENDKTKIKISDLDVYDMEINPQDSQIVFAGVQGKGLIKSFDGGASWQALPRGSLGATSSVLSFALDPQNPKNLYLASYFGLRGRILKSEDMGESFKEVFVVHADKIQILQVEVDNYNPSVIFASTSDGLFLKSEDYGISWQILKNFEEPIQKVVINQKDTREIYLSLVKGGLFKTSDKGLTWNDLMPNLEKIYSKYNLREIQEIAIDSLSLGSIYVGAGAKVFRSLNRGTDFEEINSFVVGEEYQISTILVDPADSAKIYIGGGSQVYKSVDGGKQWMVKKLETKKNIKAFKIDPANSSVIYVGVGK